MMNSENEEKLRLTIKTKDFELKEKERSFLQQITDLKNSHERELTQCELQCQSQRAHFEALVHELNNEVRNERKIRAEVERANSQQEELTASLIMNLGIEFMKWKQENTEKMLY